MKNKLKGSVPFFTTKNMGIVYLASLIVCAGLRIYHVIYLIEPQTGFYSKTDFTVALFYIFLVASCAFCMIGSFLAKDAVDFSAENVNRKPIFGILSFLLSLSFFLDFGYCFVMLGEETDVYSYETASSALSNMMRSGSLPRKAEMIFAILSFVYFLVLAIMILAKKYKGQMKVFSLVTVFWGVTRLITFFVKQISFIRISDLFLEIAATAFVTLFFFSFCKCLGNVYSDGAQWGILGLGLPASLICLTIQIPRIAAAFYDRIHFNDENYVSRLYGNDYVINYVEIVLGIFIIAILTVFLNKVIAQKNENK